MRPKLRGGLRPLFLLPVAMALAACSGISSRSSTSHFDASARSAGYQAEIRRTAMGVPHIKAGDWAGAGYGYGYAQAQDNLCTMADGFLTYRGERSEFFGAQAKPPASSTTGKPANIDSDFFHRHVITDEVIDAMDRAQPAAIRGMVEGFAAGYNRYVRDLKSGAVDKGNAHAACRNEAWVRPVSATDISAACTPPTSRRATATFSRTSRTRHRPAPGCRRPGRATRSLWRSRSAARRAWAAT